MKTGRGRASVAVVAFLSFATTVGAQDLERRIDAASGTIVFSYATRPNVCGNGSSIEISEDSTKGWQYRSRRSGVHYGTRTGRDRRCELGPAVVQLRKDGGRIVELRMTVNGPDPRAGTDLGDVPAAEASRYLLALAPTLDGKSGDDAVLGSVVADRPVDWQALLRIARDNVASESARKAAVFWVSEEATVAATRGVDSIATDDSVTLSVRKDALFYLAHRKDGEGIPALLKVAESSTSMTLRRDAIWYLAQSRDERALALFERLLAGR